MKKKKSKGKKKSKKAFDMPEMMDVVSTIMFSKVEDQPIHSQHSRTPLPTSKDDKFFEDSMAVTIVPTIKSSNWKGKKCHHIVTEFKIYLKNEKSNERELYFLDKPEFKLFKGGVYDWLFVINATYDKSKLKSPYILDLGKGVTIKSGDTGDTCFKLEDPTKNEIYITAGQICRYQFF